MFDKIIAKVNEIRHLKDKIDAISKGTVIVENPLTNEKVEFAVSETLISDTKSQMLAAKQEVKELIDNW